MARTEAPASSESHRQQQLTTPAATAPLLDSTTAFDDVPRMLQLLRQKWVMVGECVFANVGSAPIPTTGGASRHSAVVKTVGNSLAVLCRQLSHHLA